MNELELEIQALCEGFEARDKARAEINQRMIQSVKSSFEKEIEALREAYERFRNEGRQE